MTIGPLTAKRCPNCNEIFNISGVKQIEKECPAGCGALLLITPYRIEYNIMVV